MSNHTLTGVVMALALAIFLGLVAINVLYIDRELWFYFIAIGVLLVLARVLAAALVSAAADSRPRAAIGRELSALLQPKLGPQLVA